MTDERFAHRNLAWVPAAHSEWGDPRFGLGEGSPSRIAMIEPAARVERNLFRAVVVWAAASDGQVWDTDALLGATCPAALRSFNQVFVKSAAFDTRELAEVVDGYRRESPRFRVRMRGEFERELGPVMTAVGLERRGGIPSMVLEGPATPSRRGEELDLRRVVNDRTLADHVAVVAEAFDWAPDVLGTVFTSRLLSEECWRGWVGYFEGKPVAASQLVVDEGVGGIYYVGTVEASRGRGFGERLTRQAVEEAAGQRCDTVSLQASPAGYPIYARIGFKRVAEYVTYVDHEGAQHD